MGYKVRLIISTCQKASFFAEGLEKTLDEMGVDLDEVEVLRINSGATKYTNAILKKYDLYDRCRRAYCPGCKNLPREHNQFKYLPALIVDGKVMKYGSFPGKSELKELFQSDETLIVNQSEAFLRTL
jgi:hypothetical protein